MSKIISPFNGAQFINVYDDLAIPMDYCARMVQEFESINLGGASYRAEDLYGGNSRKDLMVYFGPESIALMEETFYILQQAIERYIDAHPALAGSSVRTNAIKVQKTSPKGGYHIFHSESSNLPDQVLRVLVWTIYLNDIPEGEGCTEFLEQGVSVQPKAGRVVLFPADWTHTHRGNPVYTREKYIATGWYVLNEKPYVFQQDIE